MTSAVILWLSLVAMAQPLPPVIKIEKRSFELEEACRKTLQYS
uniref:Uncharacterized protein n=1 Tax=Rhodnius prolixus TaxID=13249 RepID=T1HQ53_RHOPR